MEKKIIKDLYCFQCSLQFDKKTIYDMHLKIMHTKKSISCTKLRQPTGPCNIITFFLLSKNCTFSWEINQFLKCKTVQNLNHYFIRNVCLSMLVRGISPRILPPSPPRISTIFGDFPPKNPQNFGCPRPRPVPEPLERCSPVSVPEIRGFSGFIPKNPQSKFPKFSSPSPSPKIGELG